MHTRTYLTCTSNNWGLLASPLHPSSTLVLRTKVGVWDWEEHVYIFTAVATPNLASTAWVSRELLGCGMKVSTQGDLKEVMEKFYVSI